MEITKLNHIHFTGIKGVAMAALALCALDAGIKVTGSDVEEEFVTDETLKNRGITWTTEFSKENLSEKPDLVITTGAHGGLNNPEVLAAKEMSIPVMTHAEALAQFAKGKKIIAVCGVGGKTTTASMIATILELAGNNPSYAIGVGNIPVLGCSGKYVKDSEYFVTEADEYAISPGVDNNPRFSLLYPEVAVVTNIEHDHPDIYPTFEDTKKAFEKFLYQSKSMVANVDNKNTWDIVSGVQKPLGEYGKNGLFSMKNVTSKNGQTEFDLETTEEDVHIKLQVPGLFNVYNATAAFVVTYSIVGKEKAVEALEKYTGCQRRVEKVGEKNGVLYYDDYAHNPHEIVSVLQAIKEFYPGRRIVCTFQPHTYSRTKNLLSEFAKSFNEADVVGVVDVYSSARETDTLGMNSEILAEEIKKSHPDSGSVGYAGPLDGATDWLKENLKEGDICITLGAGDVYKIHRNLL